MYEKEKNCNILGLVNRKLRKKTKKGYQNCNGWKKRPQSTAKNIYNYFYFFWSVLIIYCFSRKVFISLKLSCVWFTPDRGNWKNLISWELWFPKKITVFNVHSKDRLSLSGYEILFNQMNQSKLKLTKQQTKVKSPLICTTMANFIKKILI